jgi:hypothetical protein
MEAQVFRKIRREWVALTTQIGVCNLLQKDVVVFSAGATSSVFS